jgi:hypothetical protein
MAKIELDYPFKNDYKAGYLNINKEPRRVLLLVRNDGSKTSLSYARYLVSCKLNRYLNIDEHVDHIDNDKLNDVIDNLQILSPYENNKKMLLHNNIKLADDISLICPVCEKEFKRPSRNIKHKLEKGKTPCCSRVCGAIHSHGNKNK